MLGLEEFWGGSNGNFCVCVWRFGAAKMGIFVFICGVLGLHQREFFVSISGVLGLP